MRLLISLCTSARKHGGEIPASGGFGKSCRANGGFRGGGRTVKNDDGWPGASLGRNDDGSARTIGAWDDQLFVGTRFSNKKHRD
ncbi:MAG: hypothetical protein P8Y36_13495 [Alphaproteobacteria bacterium]